jgi:hypothetical protein
MLSINKAQNNNLAQAHEAIIAARAAQKMGCKVLADALLRPFGNAALLVACKEIESGQSRV